MKYVIILSLIALSLFAVFFFKVISPSKEAAGLRILSEVSESDLEKVLIKNSSNNIELKKINHEWYVTEGDKSQLAYHKYTTAAINRLLQLRCEYSFTPDESLKNYGLNPADTVIQLILKSGKIVEFKIGDLSPTGSLMYLLRTGSNEIFMAPYDTVDVWKRAVPDDFKMRNVIPITYKEVKVLDIKLRDIDYQFKIEDNYPIIIQQRNGAEIEAKVDKKSFIDLIESINYLTTMNFIPVEENEIAFYKFSLDYPVFVIKVIMKNEESNQLSCSHYAGHFIYGVDEDDLHIKVLDSESVDNFVNALNKVVRIDSAQPNK